MVRKTTLFACAGIILQAVAAQAASVKNIDGHMFVSKGNGYVPAKVGMQLVPGDKLMVSNNSKGTVQFEDGCAYELTPGNVLAVQKVSPCLDSARVTDRKPDLPGRMSQSGPQDEAGLSAGAVVGGVVVGGLVVGVIISSGNKKKSP